MAMPKKDNPYLKQVEQLLEDAKAKFKLIIEQAFTVGTSSEEAKKQADAVIEATMKAYQPIKKYLGSNSFLTRNVLKTNFNLMYKTTMIAFKSANAGNPDILGTLKDLQRINKERKLTAPPSGNDANTSYIIGSDGIEMSEAPSLKFLQTDAKYGYEQMMIDDYVDKVEKQMMKLAGATLVVPNNEGKHVSLRNKAEMAVRYQDTLDDLSELEDKGSKFVVISQHQDASMRCACWQGLIYERDTNGSDIDLKGWREWNSEQNTITPQPIGTLPDGQYYYSLRDAMEHGLFSYNCRHRLIEYKEGMRVPKQYEYNSQAAQQKREVDVNMRRMENNIRMLKEREQLALTPAERKKWINKSKIAQAKYKAYANRHNRVRNDWRTTIGSVERSTNKSNKPTINPVVSELENKKVLDEIQLEDYQAFKTYIKNTPTANNLSVRFDIHVMGTKRRADELQNEYNRCVNNGKQFMGKSPLIKDSKYFEQRVLNPTPKEVVPTKNGFRLHLEFNETIGYTIDREKLLPATEYLNDKLDNYPIACNKVTIHIGKKGWHAVPESEWSK